MTKTTCASCGRELLSEICPYCEATLSAGELEPEGPGNPTDPTGPTEEFLDATWSAGPPSPGVTPVASPKAVPEVPARGPLSGERAKRRFEPGALLAGRYQIISALGRGGMGEVYRAEDLKLGETVALKFLPERVERDARRLAELLEEARLARKVTHSNICRVHDIAETEDGLHFISMEYVDGEDLASLLRRIGRLPQSKALEIARECLQALTAAHDAGVLHRDLKPANIMLDGSGRVRITDFGLASAMGTRSRGGTPAYMAPELFDGQKGTTQSDLYALGLVFYELFTGRRTFTGGSFDRVAEQHRTAQPLPPSDVAPQVDARLDGLILSCLDKNPLRRPSSLDRLDQTLQAIQDGVGEDAAATPESGSGDGDSFASWRSVPRRSRFLVGLLVAVAVGGVLLSLPWGGGSTEVPSATATPAVESAAPSVEVRPGLALLPMRNLTEDTGAAWIGLAMTEILFSELSIGGHHRLVPLHQVDEALVELGLHEQAAFQSADLQRLQRRLGVQRVVVGSYSRIVENLGGLLRVDLRLVDVEDDAILATHGATGTETQIVELALRVGEAFRRELSVEGLSPEQVLAVRGVLPSDPEAARLYVEGMARLRRLDLQEARRLLTEAAEQEPGHPLPYTALAEVWWKLGFESRARESIAKAVERSETLGTRGQQEIQARAAKYEHRLDDAISLLEGLLRAEPDRLDHHVELIEVQIAGGATVEAQVALTEARRLPLPLGEHPILDYLEAHIYQRMGQPEDQQRLAQIAAEKGEQIEVLTLVAGARLREAMAWRDLGEPQAEAVAAERARMLYEQLGNRSGLARCLQHLGGSQCHRGDLQVCQRLLLRAKELYEEIGHDLNVGTVSLSLANVDFLQGYIEEGIAKSRRAATLFRSADNVQYLAATLSNLGSFSLKQGQLQDASEYYRDALELYNSLRNRSRISLLLNGVGEIEFYRGELMGSKARHQEALAMARETGSRSTVGYATYRLAEVYRVQGDAFIADAHYQEALDILNDAGDHLSGFEVRLHLAQHALEQGDLKRTETLTRECEQYFRNSGSREFQQRAEMLIAHVLLQRSQVSEARQIVDNLRPSVLQKGSLLARYLFALLDAQVLAAEERVDEARGVLSGLVEEARRSGYLGFELEASVAAAEMMAAQTRVEAKTELRPLLERVESKGYGALASRIRKLGVS